MTKVDSYTLRVYAKYEGSIYTRSVDFVDFQVEIINTCLVDVTTTPQGAIDDKEYVVGSNFVTIASSFNEFATVPMHCPLAYYLEAVPALNGLTMDLNRNINMQTSDLNDAD